MLAACGSVKNLEPSALAGEWNIVQVGDSALAAAPGEALPFLGLDLGERRAYGYSGCNRLSAAIDVDTDGRTIAFSQAASTMMACPDMTTERKVLSALAGVKNYRVKAGKMILCGSDGEALLRLERRFLPMDSAGLRGEWQIRSVFNTPLPAGAGEKVSIAFDGQRVSGNAGCNRFFGSVTVGKGAPTALTFSELATTRMMCPDMETERRVLSALEGVKRFGRLDKRRVGLFSDGGDLLVELWKD